MSEDHAWVVFGENQQQTAEVTWHEKRSGDRRGESVPNNVNESWVYAGGRPVVCDRSMEVAALVSAMSPAISPSLDSLEVSVVQQELLWLLYDLGHLNKYPMALGNLGDLEESSPTLSRPVCNKIYEQAISVNRKVYGNRHIYPYLYSAGYHYRGGDYLAALEDWAGAAGTLANYRHSKEDEEIYKELMEINNDFIPHLLKTQEHLQSSPECFAEIIQFYDGLCSWEESSSTPVLHVGWVKPMMKCLMQFEFNTRTKVDIVTETDCSSVPVVRKVGGGGRVTARLHSDKMGGLKALLESERMNSSTLHLQLTAQSQGDSRRKGETERGDSRRRSDGARRKGEADGTRGKEGETKKTMEVEAHRSKRARRE